MTVIDHPTPQRAIDSDSLGAPVTVAVVAAIGWVTWGVVASTVVIPAARHSATALVVLTTSALLATSAVALAVAVSVGRMATGADPVPALRTIDAAASGWLVVVVLVSAHIMRSTTVDPAGFWW